MPRSFVADRFERHSLSRAEKGSLGRYSVATDISIGSAATQHWVNSVSDIYGPDEIEELLEDLNRLEMASLDADDFEIDGSQIGYSNTGMHSRHGHTHSGHGHNHRAQSALVGGSLSVDEHLSSAPMDVTASPTWSVKSWDSHTHYQEFKEPEDDPVFYPSRPMQSIVCYCDMSTFKTLRAILQLLLLVTSIACLATLLTAGTAKTKFFALPHLPRLRLMMFVTVFGIFFTIFVLFLNISHLHALLPFDFGKLQTVAYLLLTVGYSVSSSLLIHLYQTGLEVDHDQPPIHSVTKIQILIAAVLGFLCGFESLLSSLSCKGPLSYYNKIPESSTHFTLHETVTTRAVTNESITHNQPTQQTSRMGAKTSKSDPGAGRTGHPQAPTNARYHQYLVNENYDSDQVLNSAARALTKSSSGNNQHKTNTRSEGNNVAKKDHHHDHPAPQSSGTKPNPSGPPPLHHQQPAKHPTSKSNPVATAPPAPTSTTLASHVSKQSSDEPDNIVTVPGRETGAIMKQKMKPRHPRNNPNHLDEILALPMDDQ